MEYINFDVSINKLISQIFQSSQTIDINNNDNLFDYFMFLNNLRHDILHYFCLRMMGLKWKEETKISDFLGIEMPAEYKNKTPDIILERDHDLLIIDVSVSMDIHKMEKDKYNKYQPIANWLTDNYKETFYYHINVHMSYDNLEEQLTKLLSYQCNEFDYKDFFRINDVIETKKEFVHHNIDKKYFEERKILEFKRGIKTSEEQMFKDELKYVNLGSYKDIDIDLDNFMEYNKKFNIEEKVMAYNDMYDRKDMLEGLKEILEDENDPIHNKYKDRTLDTEQFMNAEIKIMTKNDKYIKRVPRPTHHIMIPLRMEETFMTHGIANEQDAIINFMSEYIENYKNMVGSHMNEKFVFLNDILQETNYALSKSLDKELNKMFFYNNFGDYTIYRDKYDEIKLKALALKEYKTRRKLSKKTCGKLGLDFDRKDKSLIIQTIDEIEKNLKNLVGNDYDLIKIVSWSFRDYLFNNDLILDDKQSTYVKKNKTIKMNISKFTQHGLNGYKKSGIKVDVSNRRVPTLQERQTIDYNYYTDVDNFLEIMIERNNDYTISEGNYKMNEYLLHDKYGYDSDYALNWKKQSVETYSPFLNVLERTNCFQYSHLQHHIYRQLLHITRMNEGENAFYYFNCGIANLLIVVAMSYVRNTADDGKPFICIIKTKYPDDYNNFYGKIYKEKIPNSDYWYIMTNWRRLSLTKITYLCDVHYSVLSSTMNTILSSPIADNYLVDKKIERIYALRTCIGYATNQKIGELLMDTRYAYMSALSVYTNIDKLLVEKFGDVHTCSLEVWIVRRLLKRLPLINTKTHQDGIIQNRIEMDNNIRDIRTIGGRINLPGLWGDYIMYDITELLDEAFIYVHTMKEPSSIFHEYIKAIKTIVKFQKEYDNLPENIKYGGVYNKKTMREYLLHDTNIGCSAPIIIESTRHTITKEKPFFKKYIDELNNENVSELLSTKAVIKDTNREIVVEEKPSKRDMKKQVSKIENTVGKKLTDEEKENIAFYYLSTKSKYYHPRKLRQKVMETVLDYVEENDNIIKTVDLANHFICQEGGNVIADICIKSQYGSKREFYVVNMGAKALARITENFFKMISSNSPNEAISVPGDKKIIHMQKMLDQIFHNPITEKHKMMYVNGDCTKWSAAETMTSFISMIYGLRENITDRTYQLLLATFNAWSNKHIQLPMDIFNKTIPITEYETNFLENMRKHNNARLSSTQNFLQGMFNYSSSYKAVCCNNFVYKIWKELYPDSKLMIQHMEHSDDYVLIILYEDKRDFIQFRILQKIMMRLHGYNDSDRKTSCQPYIMEFVSQMSFNGVMLYPQIKKSKEVNLSLPCTGYKMDVEAGLSRIGECARVGCNQSFLYFFERLHMYLISNTYSLLPGEHNNNNRTLEELHNEPIELFGIPDILPIFSLYCRGNVNNYRLYNYGDEFIKRKLRILYNYSVNAMNNEDYLAEDPDYKYSLQTPRFMYEIFNRSMNKFREKLKITTQEVKDYWMNNITYKLIKPKTKKSLITWIKAMYFNRIFMEAYTKSNRTMMTLRLSAYVKGKIIKEAVTYDDYENPIYIIQSKAMTMNDYYIKYKNICNDDKAKIDWSNEKENMLNKIITKCDPTFNAIYTILSKISVHGIKSPKSKTIQIATRTPNKLKTLNIINDPGTLLQYIFNKENFINDQRKLISRISLEKDIEEIKKKIPNFEKTNQKMITLLSLYNDLQINRQKPIIMFGYNRHTRLLADFIIETYMYNFHPGIILNVTMTNVITVIDPFDSSVMFAKDDRLTKDYHRQSVDNICLLYVLFKIVYNYNTVSIKKIFDKIIFKPPREIDDEILTYDSILRRLTTDYLDNFSYTINDKKIIGYLKAVLLNDYEVIDSLIQNVYSFSYKYVETDVPIGGKYLGRTVVNFTYFNTPVKCVYDPRKYKHPIIILNKYYQTSQIMIYNIGLRLTGLITEYDFENTMTIDRIPSMKMNDLKDIDSLLKEQGITGVIKVYESLNKIIPITKVVDGDIYIPFFLTSNRIKRTGDRSLKGYNVLPTIDENNLTVKLGKSKIYSLPFWRCNQYNNMTCSSTLEIDNIPLIQLLESNRLKRFIDPKQATDKIYINDFKYSNDLAIKNTFDSIKKSKYYDINFKNLITKELFDIIPQDVQELLKCQPGIFFLKDEKKFLDLEKMNQLYKPPKKDSHNSPIEKNEMINLLGNVIIDHDDIIDEDDYVILEDNNNEERDKSLMEFERIQQVDEFLGVNVESMNKNIFNILTKVEITDDFLIDNDEDDDDYTLLELMDEPIYTDQVYYDRKLENIFYGQTTLDDIFVLKPRRKQQQTIKKEGQGFIIQLLKQKETLFNKCLNEKYSVDDKPSYLTMYNFITTLNELMKFLTIFENNNDNYLKLLLYLKKLLCYTRITNPNQENRRNTFIIKNDKIKFYLWIPNEKRRKNDEVLDNKDGFILVKSNLTEYLKISEIQVKHKLEKIQPFYISSIIDEYLDSLRMRIYNIEMNRENR